jgi:hypothetical protein
MHNTYSTHYVPPLSTLALALPRGRPSGSVTGHTTLRINGLFQHESLGFHNYLYFVFCIHQATSTPPNSNNVAHVFLHAPTYSTYSYVILGSRCFRASEKATHWLTADPPPYKYINWFAEICRKLLRQLPQLVQFQSDTWSSDLIGQVLHLMK